ncbi:hypothetical protein [Bacillus paramycoides]|uniref:hypothetical protein n=1 Tax=Bacillus paramycoides TaxID=2026194 RepID=UPI002E1B848C|nr:hypothetical protein [Bacillus paramycoides]
MDNFATEPSTLYSLNSCCFFFRKEGTRGLTEKGKLDAQLHFYLMKLSQTIYE